MKFCVGVPRRHLIPCTSLVAVSRFFRGLTFLNTLKRFIVFLSVGNVFHVLLYFKRRRIAELEDVLERMDDEHKQELNGASLRLQNKTSEAANLRLDAERLRVRKSSVLFCRAAASQSAALPVLPVCLSVCLSVR